MFSSGYMCFPITFFKAFKVTIFTNEIIGFFGIFLVRHSSYIRRREKMPKYFFYKNIIKNYAVIFYNIKSKLQHNALNTKIGYFL
jgi:hypothetical protein